MKIIGSVFSHNSLKTLERDKNKNVRESKPYQVSTYRELVQIVANIAYKNRAYELFFRGQKKEYFNSKMQTSILPAYYRHGFPNWLDMGTIDEFINALQRKGFKFDHDETFTQFDEVKIAILQHYQVCDTPLLDLTVSLRVACSFALERVQQSGILYILGLPLINGSISFYVEEELINLKLLGICPPQALRPHFQEGFLAGTFPDPSLKEPTKRGFDVESLDFGRRLIAKFELMKKGFWDKDFKPIPHNALFPRNDEVETICNRMKASVVYGVSRVNTQGDV